MQYIRTLAALAIAISAFDVDAMPNFARREGFDCATCHINIPRLNKFGYDYRNAGFRQPDTVGKKQPAMPEFGTMNAARLQADAEWHHERAGGKTTNQGQLTFLEATLYPFTGSFGKWWSSEGELSVAPDEFFEVENAYLRGTFAGPGAGGEKMRWNLRVGVFHPFEGYGASDRPVTIARPTFQRSAARWRGGDGGTTYFTPWGFDEAGLEGGFTFGGFNVAATLFNGLVVQGSEASGEGAWKGEPFQGGELKRSTKDPNYNSKDFQLFANQFIGDAAVSAHWYHGKLTIPVDGAIGDAGSVHFTDKLDRLSFYGTLPLTKWVPKPAPPIWVLAGYERGWDTGYDVATASTTEKFGSQGWFGELWLPFTPGLGVSGRYDWWDSSKSIADSTQQVFTGAINAAALNGAQAILEYRHVFTNLDANQNKNRDQLELRVIYIF